MSLEITGKLIAKYNPQVFGEKQFKTREFVVELEEEVNGNVYTNFCKMQLVQAKCEILDRYTVGDKVKVHFNIRGRSYGDKNTGETKYITNLEGWKIEAVQQAYQQYNGQPAPAPQYGPQNSGQPYTPPPGASSSPVASDDLPF